MAIPIPRRRWFVPRRGITWFLIMVGALLAFELFNFSTTEYALGTFFGAHDALGMASWATVLAIAFCGIDFAGLSRLFTRETGWRREPKEVWLLTLAWVFGAAMNASMTWWAVATALSENPLLGNALVSREQVLHTVPLFVAGLVWLTRVTLIGSIALQGDHLFGRATAGNAPATVRGSARPLTTARPASLPERPARQEKKRSIFDRRSTPERRPVYSQGSTARQNNRASTVRSYSPARPYDRRTSGTAATASQPAYQEELTYVDLD